MTLSVRCQNPTCSRKLDVATHWTAQAAVDIHRWRVVEGELLCERCAREEE